MKNPFITGTRIYLRLLSLDDLNGDYVNWLNDPTVCKYNGHYLFPYSKKELSDYIENSWSTKDRIILAIVHQTTEKHIGNICLQNINFFHSNADLTIVLGDKDEWGKGYGKEAWLLMLKHGFGALNLHRISCATTADNLAMQKLAKSVGMQEEGIKKEAIVKNGKFIDIIEFGILRNSFY
jgi:[ribosomal protein S5]-alanine N-acetyltransferase